MKRNRTVKELMMVSLTKGIELYLSNLDVEGKSPRYIDWLKTRLKFFAGYCQAIDPDINLQDLSVDDGREFLRSLMEREKKYNGHPLKKEVTGKLAPSYIHGCGRAIRSFSSWAHREGYLEENVFSAMKLPKLPKTYPEPLSEDEIRQVLDACLENSLENSRNFAIFSLLFDTGLRLSEGTGLRMSDVDFAVGEVKVLGKGRKERIVPIGLQAKRALINYVERDRPEPRNPNDATLFLSADGYPMTTDSMEKMFQRIKKQAKLGKLHPHLCRHTFAVRYLINGGDVFTLQKILGHESLEMTRKYVYLASGDVKEKHRRFSPMDNLEFRKVRRGRRRMDSGTKV